MPRITRRKLLSKGAQTIAAGSAAFAAVPILATRAVCKVVDRGRGLLPETRCNPVHQCRRHLYRSLSFDNAR